MPNGENVIAPVEQAGNFDYSLLTLPGSGASHELQEASRG